VVLEETTEVAKGVVVTKVEVQVAYKVMEAIVAVAILARGGTLGLGRYLAVGMFDMPPRQV
jgi:hypothetical protein